MNTPEELQRLFTKEKWSAEDKRQVLDYLESTDNAALRQLMQDKFIEDAQTKEIHPDAEKLLAVIHKKMVPTTGRSAVFFSGKRKYFSIAALLLLVFGAGLVYILMNKNEAQGNRLSQLAAVPKAEILPGINQAKLTLADGAVIALDGAANGTLAKQGNTNVIKSGGKVSYAPASAISGKPVYNTMSTAKGNQYQLQLSDGTKVWLNAASSITFPVSFSGEERSVSITGEVYFEVAHDAAKPFRVDIRNAAGKEGEIEVLGTHFNVNAYDDETSVKTTLVEGKVRIVKGNNTSLLLPSQQAVWRKDGSSLKIQDADIEKELAWTTGMFEFRNDDVQTIMRQLARWYDIDVQFSSRPSKKIFNGSVPRQSNLSQVLQILKLAGANFEVNNRTLIVQ